MNIIDSAYLMKFLRNAAWRLEQERGPLCTLDGEIGDGDHGTSMADGFAAISKRLKDPDLTGATPARVLQEAAKAFIGEVGATVGPLYASAFLEAARQLETITLEQRQVGLLMQYFADGIAKRGKANLGDKTMLDVWLPAAQAAQRAAANGMTLQEVTQTAARVAQNSARETTSMIAIRGRAARLNERSLGKLDPGAASAAMIIEVFAELAQDKS